MKRIAILGGGPSGLFMFKRLVESGQTDWYVDVFERKQQLGAGMPYSTEGAGREHITNVSGNEIPGLVTPISDWVKTLPEETVLQFGINPDNFNDYKVLPRLLFGQYLAAQFNLLRSKAEEAGIHTDFHLNADVADVIDFPDKDKVEVVLASKERFEFDHVIICTGHNWPGKLEGQVAGYFDSPYPPDKLALKLNHPVAVRGSSLTAIDAIRTLARNNGSFKRDNGSLNFALADASENFKLVMHSKNGLLPAIRFHLEDSHLMKDAVLSKEEIEQNRAENEGFLSLDYVFEQNFKYLIRSRDPEFYEQIKQMQLEEFVTAMMELRERLDPFQLFEAEYAQAEKSIKRKESVYWKEMLAVLSFAMNYPAKYFSAEDRQRLEKHLMPLIAIVIAFVPQQSAQEMLALYHRGVLELVPVGDDSEVEPQSGGGIIYHYTSEDNQQNACSFQTFVDCIGQPHLSADDFPFKSLLEQKAISRAQLKFRDPEKAVRELEAGNKKVKPDGIGGFYLDVPGITINDSFQVLDEYNALNERIYIMAVPYIGGYNPDYSGLDFGEAASEAILKSLI